MALSNQTVKSVAVANGVNTAYSIPFPMIQSDSNEVKVFKRDESVTPAVVTQAVEGSDYDLTGRATPSDFNTTVTFRVAPAAGLKIQIERELALTQTLALLANGPINLKDFETAWDRAIAILQQLNFAISRAPKFSRTSGLANLDMPDVRAGEVLAFNVAGTALTTVTAAGLLNLANALAVSNNLSDLSNVTTALNNLGISPLTVQRKVSFTDGQAAALVAGELFDGTIATSVIYEYEVIRGTTIVATGRFSLQYKNNTWGVVDGGYEGDPHGLSFSVSQTGSQMQLRIAASSSGGGNGTIKLKKHIFLV